MWPFQGLLELLQPFWSPVEVLFCSHFGSTPEAYLEDKRGEEEQPELERQGFFKGSLPFLRPFLKDSYPFLRPSLKDSYPVLRPF